MNGKTKWIAALCLLPFIVLFGAFQIAPLVWIAVHSFFSEQRLGMGQLCRYPHLAVLPAGLSVLTGDLAVVERLRLADCVSGQLLAAPARPEPIS